MKEPRPIFEMSEIFSDKYWLELKLWGEIFYKDADGNVFRVWMQHAGYGKKDS